MKRFAALWVVVGLLVGPSDMARAAEKRLNVVATLSTFGNLVKEIGADFVAVSSIASPKFNPHFIEPRPSDVLKVKRADLFVHAGLDLELWRGPLLDAAGNLAVMPGGPGELDLSQGIALLEVPTGPVSRAQGDIHLYGNPHYWLDPENAKIMARTICEKLSAVDPLHEQDYRRNLQAFTSRLDGKMTDWKRRLAPYQGRELVGYHNEWPYLMRFVGARMEQFLEPKPGIPPTPKQLQSIERYAKAHQVSAIAQSTFYPTQAAEVVAKHVGMTLVLLCQNVGEVPAASDYIAMVDYNIAQLVRAFSEPARG